MSSQPRTSKNKRPRQHYNKPRITDLANKDVKLIAGENCRCNKRNHKCKRCDSCINININASSTDCAVVNDQCNAGLAACYEIVGDNLQYRLACGDAYNKCISNAGCEQPAQGGGDDDKYDKYRECLVGVYPCAIKCQNEGGERFQCMSTCTAECDKYR